MGFSKTFVFSDEQNQISVLMKAMAHPARIAIVEFLAKSGRQYKYIFDDIAQEIPLALTTVYQHVQELKKAGLIKEKYVGSRVHYAFDKKVFSVIGDYCDELGKRKKS